MSRYPITPKTIQGKPVTQQVFLNTIVDLLYETGGGRAGDLVMKLGPEWETPDARQALSHTLNNMARRGTISRVPDSRGVYEVSEGRKRMGVSAFDRMEKDILDVIRAHGGFCRMRDILEAFDVRPAGPDRQDMMNDPIYVRIGQVIRKSTLIRQDHLKRGIYNLPWEQTLTLPLRGHWAGMCIQAGYEMACDTARAPKAEQVWRDERDAYFSNVGSAFKALREMAGWTPEQVVEQDAVKAALLTLQRAADDEVNIVRAAWMDRMTLKRRELEAAGASAAEINAYVDEEMARLDPTMPRSLYKRFEKGAVGAHFHAPLTLYTAVADLFGVCAASLSRGMIAARPFEERMRPAQTNYVPA